MIFGKENMLEGNNGTTGFFSTPHVIEVALSSLHNSGVEFSTGEFATNQIWRGGANQWPLVEKHYSL